MDQVQGTLNGTGSYGCHFCTFFVVPDHKKIQGKAYAHRQIIFCRYLDTPREDAVPNSAARIHAFVAHSRDKALQVLMRYCNTFLEEVLVPFLYSDQISLHPQDLDMMRKSPPFQANL